MEQRVNTWISSTRSNILYLGGCLVTGILFTRVIPEAIRDMERPQEYFAAAFRCHDFAALSIVFPLGLLFLLARESFIAWKGGSEAGEGRKFHFPGSAAGVILLCLFWAGSFWCAGHDVGMEGHMCNGPYDTSHYLFDGLWIFMGLSAVIREAFRDNIRSGIYLFFVAMLMYHRFGIPLSYYF